MDWTATFLIVFREALEVALTLVLVLAATQSLAHRQKWIFGGFAGGVFGSIVLAHFTNAISESMEGMGQEVFNAAVLSISAFLIGMTVVWMQHHAQHLVKNLKETSKAVVEGSKPMWALSLVILLTVLRDGAEVVLLSQGLFAMSNKVASLLMGGALGLVAGALLGVGMYRGIVRLKVNVVFDVISIMLIFVAAGMAAQAAGFFAASGIIEALSSTVWDSSHYLSEHSHIGELAHVLFGYTSRPSGMQLVWYGLTLLTVFVGWFSVRSQRSRTFGAGAVAAAFVLAVWYGLIAPQNANAIDKIYSPIVHSGELELETRGTYDFDDRDERDGAWEQKWGFGGALADRWAAELYLETEKEKGEDLELEAVALETRWQLFEQGEYWLDTGLYLEYELATESEAADKLEGKILLEKGYGQFEHRANIIFEREVGGYSEDETELEFSAVSRYRVNEFLEPGVEWHSAFGEIDDLGTWSSQKHNVGPAVYGKLGGGFRYELSLLFGVSTEATDTVLRGVLEYEWYL